MYFWDKQIIGKLLVSAAQCALHLQQKLEVKEKGTNDIYTSGDVAVEKLFSQALDRPEKNQHLIGEETIFDYIQNKSLKDIFFHTAYIVDPIDGTVNYLNRLPNWGISIGVVHENEIVQGAVVLPDLRELFVSDNDNVYYVKFDKGIEHVSTTEHISFVPLIDSWHNPYEKYQLFVRSHKKYATNNSYAPYHVNRSSVYSAIKVLTGHYWGYVSNAKIWDLAGCIGLFRRMKKDIFYVDGTKLKQFSYAATDEYWIDLLSSRYDIIFAQSKEHAEKLVANSIKS